MVLKTKVFRSLWGVDYLKLNQTSITSTSTSSVFDKITGMLKVFKAKGIHGVECSLSDMGTTFAERQLFAIACKDQDMECIIGIYSAWCDYEGTWDDLYHPIESHLSTFEKQLKEAVILNPVHINSHSGSDHWNESQSISFFHEAVHISEKYNISISHETHRGRALFNPWVTERILNQVNGLKLTSDLSHWILSTERLFTTPQEIKLLENLAPHVAHVHARIGSTQHPQIPLPITTTSLNHDERSLHERWWRMVALAHIRAGRQCMTLTPEYGPPPYAPTTLLSTSFPSLPITPSISIPISSQDSDNENQSSCAMSTSNSSLFSDSVDEECQRLVELTSSAQWP
eukprot:gene6582-13315_t